MSYKQQLLNRIENHSAVVGVVGMGYVGLPLAVEFAEAGFQVIALDVNERHMVRRVAHEERVFLSAMRQVRYAG